MKVTLSRTLQKIQGWWREKVNIFYDSVLDTKLDQFIKDVQKHPSMTPEGSEFYKNLKPELKEYLKKAQRIKNELGHLEQSSAQKQEEISENIKPILLDSGVMKPVQFLAERMARHRSLALDRDRDSWLNLSFSLPFDFYSTTIIWNASC